MSVSRRLARPLLAATYVSGGVETLRHPGARVKASEDVVPKLNSQTGLHLDTEQVVKLDAGIRIGAGFLLAVGKFRRLAALLLIGSTALDAYTDHRFWEMDDAAGRTEAQVGFLKDLGLIGGLLLEIVDTEGAPSLGWRARRASKRAAAAISRSGNSSSDRTTALVNRAGRTASGAASAVVAGAQAGKAGGGQLVTEADRRTRRARRAADRAARLAAENVRHLTTAPAEVASDLWSSTPEWATEALDAGAREAAHLIEAGSDRAAQLLAAGAHRAGEAWQGATERLS